MVQGLRGVSEADGPVLPFLFSNLTNEQSGFIIKKVVF